MIERRKFMGIIGAGAGLFAVPGFAVAQAATDRRFFFVIQRGAADGIGTLIPSGDPALQAARGALMVEGATKLDAMFSLHPALSEVNSMFARKEALFAHAVASPYRDRSHFDAQNVLESGGSAAYSMKTGWMNRLVTMLPKAEAKAIALSPTIPMALRGTAEVASYAPSNLPEASADLMARVGQLYSQDAQLHGLWEQALQTRNMAGNASDLNGRNAATMGALTAKLMAGQNGARIAMVETNGWDTHSAQKGRLANQLKGLDALIGALRTGLGAEWSKTLVIVATEFGRTVAVNGTGGTDHGTASAAMLLGGAVDGGRVIADWPGLSQSSLHEGRDLRPTLALDDLIASAVAAHFQLDPARAFATLFPEGGKASLPPRLIRS
jgi:uncharacterized protein (DUF1501 family)